MRYKTIILTDKLVFTSNHLAKGQYKINPKVTRNVGKINAQAYFTQINVEIKDSEEAHFPFNMEVSLRAVFEFQDFPPENEIYDFLKIPAVNILYPYVRSAVTSLTAMSMNPPIVLPIVDASVLFTDTAPDSYIIS